MPPLDSPRQEKFAVVRVEPTEDQLDAAFNVVASLDYLPETQENWLGFLKLVYMTMVKASPRYEAVDLLNQLLVPGIYDQPDFELWLTSNQSRFGRTPIEMIEHGRLAELLDHANQLIDGAYT